MKDRLKNPYFWIGLGGVVLTAMGADISMFTSWGILLDSFLDLVKNPFMLFTVAMAVLGVFTDTTTPKIKNIKKKEKEEDKEVA